mmetsp:Transcript_28842/g.92749  ORF Transcript_28842/g.92749 Transcript_28842/m.92749 type:complete len:209 (-) Transcript_28842:58-684(-)
MDPEEHNRPLSLCTVYSDSLVPRATTGLPHPRSPLSSHSHFALRLSFHEPVHQIDAGLRETQHVYAALVVGRAHLEHARRFWARPGDSHESHSRQKAGSAVRIGAWHARLADSPIGAEVELCRVRQLEGMCRGARLTVLDAVLVDQAHPNCPKARALHVCELWRHLGGDVLSRSGDTLLIGRAVNPVGQPNAGPFEGLRTERRRPERR